MNPLEPVAAVSADKAIALAPLTNMAEPSPASGQIDFAGLFSRGLEQMEQKIDTANAMVRAFTLDESVPVHQVTIALEEARIAVEMTMQVRTRLVEAYRELMNTQL